MRIWPLLLVAAALACTDATKPPDIIDTGLTGHASDGDGDGYTSDEDCNDDDSVIHPGATEICDGIDNNCDGQIDEELGDTFYEDADDDGYGNAKATVTACDQPAGYVPTSSDCDDNDANAFPGNLEVCDGADNDCNGETDEGTGDTYYVDADGDGFGDPKSGTALCEEQSGYVTDNTDCNDSEASAYPGGQEVCDDVDNDCDGDTDEDDATDASTFYIDEDGDGYGDADTSAVGCDAPKGYVATDDDCDDADSAQYPGADEYCNGEDDDCDDETDESDAIDADIWYADADGDTYGDSTSSAYACEQPSAYVADDNDCDDTRDDVNPGATEVCNDDADNDCDGSAFPCASDVSVADATLLGATAGDAAGCAVAGAGDVNGDGQGDFVVGAFQESTNATDGGATYLWFGPVSGEHSLSDADAIFWGSVDYGYTGYAVDGGFDFNDDGYSDVLVGGYMVTDGSDYPGAAYLIHGPVSGEVDLSDADAILWGADDGASTGEALSNAGDVDGDGADEILVGAPDLDGYTGAIYLVDETTGQMDLADATAIIDGESAGDFIGSFLTGGSDINADGYDDIVIGAHSDDDAAGNAGAAYVLYGPISDQTLGSSNHKLLGEAYGDYAGRSVDMAGDIDGDGNGDFIVGAPYNDEGDTNSGAAYVIHGPVSGTQNLSDAEMRITGSEYSGYGGMDIGAGGDVTGDGTMDLLFGIPNMDFSASNEGGVAVMDASASGEVETHDAEAMLAGLNNGDYLGRALEIIDDTDGDGRSDALVGTRYQDESGTNAGAVYLFNGIGE